ncbi:Similar to Acetoacetyl-CoA synthetase; acc. no. A3QK15 [Pyronema omphalodes CBS 100304]|uniref:Similar to Acetoacetyl-CoA synthetase acc. no. A3QK15 n=1 Tax=Pyronema omphalodes (strain CBS 100304) TaxID=1076935 RepID=U4LJG7_PYROM|nr:Similar to Acetoacetyl-CoA synthetase; acc. no. A3QK15 [Pyronema omphalodes CBS 100304]
MILDSYRLLSTKHHIITTSQHYHFTTPPPYRPTALYQHLRWPATVPKSHSRQKQQLQKPPSQARSYGSTPRRRIRRCINFKAHIAHKYKQEFSGEEDASNSLWKWSVENIPEFWGEVWDRVGIRASKRYNEVVDATLPMFPRTAWFSGAKLNFAENILFPTVPIDPSSTAVISATEEHRSHWTWTDLRERVRVYAAALSSSIIPGDRVVGFVGNHEDALIAMLATTSLGGVWSGISPDNGATAVLNRWEQLQPTVMFADNAVFYNGRAHDSMSKLGEIVKGLPSLKHLPIETHKLEVANGPAWLDEEFLGSAIDQDRPLEFLQLEADWPVYILFSSGTTGKPKCICHGAIGTLIQHKKEHMLQGDMRKGDVFFQYTTVTWMMWHWLVSGLAVGATIVLYDGSPFPKYLSLLEQNSAAPRSKYPLKALRAIYSTAAVLAPSTFDYVYRSFGPVNLASITGGTDIISLFGAPSPLVPVYAGEIQAIGLGMAVNCWDPEGKPTEEAGDLVCTKAFPCQPVKFAGLEGEEKYRKSYLDVFRPTEWHHGDFLKINKDTRGMIMLGRSDGMLKPSGVRFGSAEIYNLLFKFFPEEVEDALCIGRRRKKDKDENGGGGNMCSEELKGSIREVVKREMSGRHVPAVIDPTPELPVTTNGKKIEVAVKQILSGWDVKISASCANPGALEWFRKCGSEH